VFSRATFGEFSEILMTRGPFSELTRETRGAYIAQLSEVASWVKPVPQPVKCRDPGDQPFLDLAVAAGADYLVTGDPDLLEIGKVAETRILSPADFMGTWRKSQLVSQFPYELEPKITASTPSLGYPRAP